MNTQQTANRIHSALRFDPSLWINELDQAITANDTVGMWRLVGSHADQEEASRLLVERIPRIAYQINKRTYFSEMFLMPVVISGNGDIIDNANCWKEANFCVSEMLDTWLPPQTFKTVFHGIRPYDHLGTWQPAVIRKHLLRAIPSESPSQIRYNIEVIQLPTGAPRLGFVSMVLTTKTRWPVLPPADTLRDNRLRRVISLALHNTGDSFVEAPIVLPPDRIQFAVADGLALWLHQLNQVYPITGWSLALRPSSPDLVLITLRLEAESQWTQFAIRKYQIGNDGLNELLTLLQSLAPTLDWPNDMPPPEKSSVELPL